MHKNYAEILKIFCAIQAHKRLQIAIWNLIVSVEKSFNFSITIFFGLIAFLV